MAAYGLSNGRLHTLCILYVPALGHFYLAGLLYFTMWPPMAVSYYMFFVVF